MKKLSILFLSVAMITSFAAPSFAMLRKDLASVKGSVVYINSTRTEITVKDVGTGKDVTFTSPGVPVDILSGSPVIVLYKKGTMNATSVRHVGAKRAGAMKAAPAAASSASTMQAPKTATTTTAPKATTAATPAKQSKYGW